MQCRREGRREEALAKEKGFRANRQICATAQETKLATNWTREISLQNSSLLKHMVLEGPFPQATQDLWALSSQVIC